MTELLHYFVAKQQTMKLRKEAMWGHYHQLRSSAVFHSEWAKFVQESVEIAPSPVLYQQVTHEVFKSLIKAHYPIAIQVEGTEDALTYVAGYVCSKVSQKLQSSFLNNKDDHILCIHDMCSYEVYIDEQTEEWLNVIAWGGPWHINSHT